MCGVRDPSGAAGSGNQGSGRREDVKSRTGSGTKMKDRDHPGKASGDQQLGAPGRAKRTS